VGKNGIEKQKEGDKKTPLGVYFTGSRLAQRKLPDLYGSAAYPLSYPNEWDRRLGKSGHGIWMHGTPSDTYSRPPRASDGCVVLTNQDINSLETIFRKSGIPVVIAPSAAPEDTASQKQALLDAIERWRKDWESQETDVYLTHYARDFFTADMNLERWASEKRRIQRLKPKVSVALSDVSIFRYPDASKKMVVVNFNQDYKADHFSHKMRKRQYWMLDNGRWKILYEGAA
jgi:murein L,D-transpeptidase YafK